MRPAVGVVIDQVDVRHFGHAVHEKDGGHDNADLDRDGQVDHHGKPEGHQKDQEVAALAP